MQTAEFVKKNNKNIDNPFIEKENDIMLNNLRDEDRKVLQKKLLALYKFNTALHLEYLSKEKRLEHLNLFQEKLDDVIIYLTNVYLLLKGDDIKNIKKLEDSDFTEKNISNLSLEIDFKEIDSFTFGSISSRRSFLSLFSVCKNLQAKINKKRQVILDEIEKQKSENKKEESKVY